MANADTPMDVVYVSELEIFHEAIVAELENLIAKKLFNPLNARAPPHFS